MDSFLRHFWLLFIVVNVVNSYLWWRRGSAAREEDPSLTDSYRTLCLAHATWGSVPWIVMGAGLELGGVPSIFHYFNPRSSNPYIGAFFLSWIGIAASTTYWLFARGGAEELIRHPGLLQTDFSDPRKLKLVAAVSLVGAVVAILGMYFGLLGVPNLDSEQ